MKTIFVYTTALFAACCFYAHSQDPVKNAYKENEEKADRDLVDKNVAEFLVKTTEGRLIIINESRLGVLKGSTSEVRNYAQLLIKDQTSMLDELKKIASERNITLPDGVSDKMRAGQMDLSEEAGKEFDEKFIKMIHAALERDIRLLEKVNEFSDKGISAFAEKYTPMIQLQLERSERIVEEDL
jgi:putative membrane protein